MPTNVSVLDYFKQLNAYSQEMNSNSPRVEKKYLTLSSKAASGSTVTFRIIPDVNGCPVRLVHNVYEIWIATQSLDDNGNPVLDETGNPRWYNRRHTICGLSNYQDIELTPDQKALVNETYNLIDRYNKLVWDEVIDPDEVGLSMTHRVEVSLWWAKVLRCIGGNNLIDEPNRVYLVRHHGRSFFQDYCKAITDKTELKGSGEWLEKYMNRVPGKYEELCSVSTTLDKGYKSIVTFDTGASFDVTQDDIESATDLRTEYVNVLDFNADQYILIRDKIKEILDKYGNTAVAASGMTPAEPVQPVDAKEAYAHVSSPAPNNTPASVGGFTGAPFSGSIPPMGPPTSL